MENILEAVKYLSAPFESKTDDINKVESAASLLTALTVKCLTKLEWSEVPNVEYMENSLVSPAWKLTCTILQVLTDLRKYIEEAEANQSVEERSIEVLSLQSQLAVQKCVEIVIGFGIIPYLIPGVGVPEKLRKTHIKSDLFCGDDRNVPPLHQFYRLAHVVENLLTLCEHPSLNTLILPQYNCDILASLLQLCKSPLSKPELPLDNTSSSPESSESQIKLPQEGDEQQQKFGSNTPVSGESTKEGESSSSSSRSSKSSALTLDEYKCVLSRREKLNLLMEDKLLSSKVLPGEILVHSLLVIGSSVRPRWIGPSCYEILYSILLSTERNGLRTISRAILGSLGRSSVWKVSRVISNLVTEAIRLGPPVDNNNEQLLMGEPVVGDPRVGSISSQAYDMLLVNCSSIDLDNLEPSEAETKQCLTTIAITCGLTLLSINQEVTMKYFWTLVFEPLLTLSQTLTTTTTSNSVTVNIDKLQACTLPVAELLLTVAPAIDFSPFVILKCFQSVWPVIFQLFVTCEVYLRRKVQEPRVADRIEKLHRKLEAVLVSLFEVLNSMTAEDDTLSDPDSVVAGDGGESSTFLCEFCIHLILNDVEEAESQSNFRVNRFQFDIGECLDDPSRKSRSDDDDGGDDYNDDEVQLAHQSGGGGGGEGVKIVIVCSRCQNHDDDNNAFERLSDDCAILSATILKNERVKRVTAKLFCQLLGYTEKNQQGEEQKQRQEADDDVALESTCRHHTHQSDDNFVAHSANSRNDSSVSPSSPSSSSSSRNVDDDSSTTIDSSTTKSPKNDLPSTPHKIKSNVPSTTTTTTATTIAAADAVPTTAVGTTKSNDQDQKTNNQILNQLDLREQAQCQKFVAMKLLGDLGTDERIMEDLGATESPEKTLNLLELIIKKLTIEMASSASTGDEYEFGQSVIFCLSILGTLCETSSTSYPESSQMPNFQRNRRQKDFWDDLKRFAPYLQKFQETCHLGLSSLGIPAMAENILILIETKGVGLDGTRRGKKKVRELSRFDIAMGDVASPILPIKGHGLLELKRLVEAKDPETLKNEERLLHIFQREMKSQDSYLYLMAIQGMATLGLKFHSIAVPILIREYGGFEESQWKKMSHSTPASSSSGLMRVAGGIGGEDRAEFRMKIGEALVKIVQRLGDIAPVYRVPLTNVCFHLVRDQDPLIRASSLSNLGELCHLLKFTLGVILTEVWQTVEALLTLEKHVEVRRAALHLIVLLLRGVEKDFSAKYLAEDRVIGGYLRDVRRLLTRIHETEKDPVASIHAQLALQEMELIVRKLLTPSSKLEYEIRVLDP